MSAPTNLERYLGGFAYFIPGGVTVDGGVVSHLIKPDVVPLSNWTDYDLGSILNIKLDSKKKDLSYTAPSASGGWEVKPRFAVEQDFIDMETREMGELLLRLQFGLSGVIVEGTAQTPFASTDRRLDGWLRLQTRQETGQDLNIVDVWSTLELTSGLAADGTVTQPKFRFTVIKTVAGTAVAGNSIVFPVAV